MKNHKLVFSFISSFIVAALFLLIHPHIAAAATISVNSTSDVAANDGVCTFREAIISANTNAVSGAAGGECGAGSAGADTINFAIAGSGLHTIASTGGYNTIQEPVTINGYSQTGSSKNTAVAPAALNGNPTIEFDGSTAATGFIVFAAGSTGSTIQGLIINSFSGNGIEIQTTNINVYGNYIGTDSTGLIDKGNTGPGIGNAAGSSTGAHIGSTDPGDRNLISGNEDSAAYPYSGWVIQGNYIGVDKTGLTAMGNSTIGASGGFSIDNCTDVIVGGTSTGAGNVISGNLSHGVSPDNADNLTVQGNYIGVGRDGTTLIGNGGGGLAMTNSNHVVFGGTQAGAGNIVAGNSADNVYIGAGNTDITVQGNTILANAAGRNIAVNSSTGVVIGGTQAGAGNTITDSVTQGISISSGSSDVTVQGNDIDGSTTDGVNISNSSNVIVQSNSVTNSSQKGISITNSSSSITIGGTQNGQGNTITGSGQQGIYNNTITGTLIQGNEISNSASDGILLLADTSTQVTGNNIHNNTAAGINLTGTTGTSVRGNKIKQNVTGVNFFNAGNNTVGGSSLSDRNIISGNTGYANIFILGFGSPADSNVIQGNYIGTNDSGQYDNTITQSVGVFIYASASSNLIGGSSTGQGNVIAGNSGAGVLVASATLDPTQGGTVVAPTNNAIIGNNIFDNQSGTNPAVNLSFNGLGIDLVNFQLNTSFAPVSVTQGGPTLNDVGDTDSGTNNYMNFPVVNSTSQNKNAVTVNYNLSANDADTTSNTYRVEFFANDTTDPSGYGEGQTYLGAVTASNGDNQTANLTVPNGTDLTGKKITATTTAINTGPASGFGASSEFSLASSNVTVIAPATNSSSISTALANTGQNAMIILSLAGGLVVAGGSLLKKYVL